MIQQTRRASQRVQRNKKSVPTSFVIPEMDTIDDGAFFDTLIETLRKNGYTVALAGDNQDQALITGKRIRGSFQRVGTSDDDPRTDGRFCFDNAQCFDTPSRSPYALLLPRTQAQMMYLLEQMQYMATKEGVALSNNYLHHQERDYPFRGARK